MANIEKLIKELPSVVGGSLKTILRGDSTIRDRTILKVVGSDKILEGMMQGYNVNDIAEELGVSKRSLLNEIKNSDVLTLLALDFRIDNISETYNVKKMIDKQLPSSEDDIKLQKTLGLIKIRDSLANSISPVKSKETLDLDTGEIAPSIIIEGDDDSSPINSAVKLEELKEGYVYSRGKSKKLDIDAEISELTNIDNFIG